MELRIANLADRDLWEAIHAEGGIPAHAHGVAAALAASGIEPRLALVRSTNGGMVLPYFERRWQGTTDICTWLSVSGARLWGDSIPALAAWEAHARACGWVAGYIQVEPESPLPGIAAAGTGNMVFLLDLALPDPLTASSRSIRRKLREADAAGAVLVEDREALAAALVHLYPPAMARLGASEAYALPAATLRALATTPDVLVLGAAGHDGQIAVVMTFPVAGDRAEGFLLASTPEGRDLITWLLGQAIRRLRADGVRRLNLGGGVRPGDGLFDFKARFGGTPRPLGVLRQVYDPATYAALCTAAAESGGNWFPAYRAPRGTGWTHVSSATPRLVANVSMGVR
jgi:hypothetical protein